MGSHERSEVRTAWKGGDVSTGVCPSISAPFACLGSPVHLAAAFSFPIGRNGARIHRSWDHGPLPCAWAFQTARLCYKWGKSQIKVVFKAIHGHMWAGMSSETIRIDRGIVGGCTHWTPTRHSSDSGTRRFVNDMKMMASDLSLLEELEISRLAFKLWQEAGRPENGLEEYWKRAESKVLGRRIFDPIQLPASHRRNTTPKPGRRTRLRPV